MILYIYSGYFAWYIAHNVYKILLCGYFYENYNYIYLMHNKIISTNNFYLLVGLFLEHRRNTRTLRYLWRSWNEKFGWPWRLDTAGDNSTIHRDRRNSLFSSGRWWSGQNRATWHSSNAVGCFCITYSFRKPWFLILGQYLRSGRY